MGTRSTGPLWAVPAPAGPADRRYSSGCYVDEDEIHVVQFLKTQGRPVYSLEILKPRDEDGEGNGERWVSTNACLLSRGAGW